MGRWSGAGRGAGPSEAVPCPTCWPTCPTCSRCTCTCPPPAPTPHHTSPPLDLQHRVRQRFDELVETPAAPKVCGGACMHACMRVHVRLGVWVWSASWQRCAAWDLGAGVRAAARCPCTASGAAASLPHCPAAPCLPCSPLLCSARPRPPPRPPPPRRSSPPPLPRRWRRRRRSTRVRRLQAGGGWLMSCRLGADWPLPAVAVPPPRLQRARRRRLTMRTDGHVFRPVRCMPCRAALPGRTGVGLVRPAVRTMAAVQPPPLPPHLSSCGGDARLSPLAVKNLMSPAPAPRCGGGMIVPHAALRCAAAAATRRSNFIPSFF